MDTEVDEAKKTHAAQPTNAPTSWQFKIHFSDILDDHISRISSRKQPLINNTRNAIKNFALLKLKKLVALEQNKEVIMPKSLYTDNNDRGKFKAPWLRDFDHYHLKLGDARNGDISVIYKWGIDLPNKVLNLYIAAVGDHKDDDNKNFGAACQTAEYPKFDLLKKLEEQLHKVKQDQLID